MKKLLFIFAILSGIALSSCSDDAEVIVTDIDDISLTSDDLLEQDMSEFDGWTSSSDNTAASRSSVNTITLKGYSSKTSSGNQKVYILKDLANLIGISSQIYVVEYITAFQDFTISGLGTTSFFSTADSPLCGVDPNGKDWTIRGYAASSPTPNGEIRLSSKCIHVICDMSGRTYDKWYPCRPEQFLWNYTLVNI